MTILLSMFMYVARKAKQSSSGMDRSLFWSTLLTSKTAI